MDISFFFEKYKKFKREMNRRSLIQPLEILPVELTGTHSDKLLLIVIIRVKN